MWSPVEKTALAEAEIEYEDVVSTQIDVAFEILESAIPELVGAHAVIWTTTPWTIPVNQAIAYGPDVDYVLLRDGRSPRSYLVAKELANAFQERGGTTTVGPYVWHESEWPTFKGSALAGTISRHPMHHFGGFFGKPRPFL